MISLITICLKLFYQIFTEYFSAKRKKQKADQAYKLDMEEFRDIVNKSLNKLTQEARKDSSLAKDVEDQVDAELNNKTSNDRGSDR